MYLCIYNCKCTCVHVYVIVQLYMYRCIGVCVYSGICIVVYVYVYIQLYIPLYIYPYVLKQSSHSRIFRTYIDLSGRAIQSEVHRNSSPPALQQHTGRRSSSESHCMSWHGSGVLSEIPHGISGICDPTWVICLQSKCI